MKLKERVEKIEEEVMERQLVFPDDSSKWRTWMEAAMMYIEREREKGRIVEAAKKVLNALPPPLRERVIYLIEENLEAEGE